MCRTKKKKKSGGDMSPHDKIYPSKMTQRHNLLYKHIIARMPWEKKKPSAYAYAT